MEKKESLDWWKSASFYHIYPLSFMDSNNDGFGDIQGIIMKLDYLSWLGIDAIWISPIYPSPLKDNGYDVKDFFGIDPVFGTMSDFEELLKQAHAKKIKLILDFVPNHTSEEHPWFIDARSSKSNSKRDWYLWADPNPNGGLPNNWDSLAGGSSWTFDRTTNQYFYHTFLKEQPDLNWRNNEVQRMFFEIMHFWLDKGVDGFRLDLIGFLIKDKLLRNNPPNARKEKDSALHHELAQTFSAHQPEVNEIIGKMRAVVDEYKNKVLLGELSLSIDELIHYHHDDRGGIHLPGNYLFILEEWKASILFEEICNYEASLTSESWPNWVLSNHDNTRIASRVGRDQARIAAFLMLTSRGTPIIYYGDEIGMQDMAVSKTKMQDLSEIGRDPQRTPMQWSMENNAGFTQGIPWLNVNSDYKTYNVEEEKKDPDSMLNLYRDLLQLRREIPTLIHGTFIPVGVQEDVFAFLRQDKETHLTFLVVCNLGHKATFFQIPEFFSFSGTVLYGTNLSRKGESIGKEIAINGDEALLITINEG
jgi:alpha-glucosidase